MSSRSDAWFSAGLTDDRTTKARIRDAAIEVIAERGPSGLTARRVAAAVGVSPGSVIHHFGSIESLRTACDEHIAAIVRHQKQSAMSAGPNVDLVGQLREASLGPVVAYLARVLADESPAVDGLVDEMVADAEVYLEEGVRTGMICPSQDPHARAVVLSIWSLGALAMHRHLRRLLGVDLTDSETTSAAGLAEYARPIYELYGSGLFTEELSSKTQAALAEIAEEGTE